MANHNLQILTAILLSKGTISPRELDRWLLSADDYDLEKTRLIMKKKEEEEKEQTAVGNSSEQ